LALNPNQLSPHRPNRRKISLDVSPEQSDHCDDRNPVKQNSMSENAIDSVKATPEPAAAKPRRKTGKKSQPKQKAGRANKKAHGPKA
jgi:hypothetical protein